jgi:hypothetical protein
MKEKKTKLKNYLRVWGCLAFHRVLDSKMIKLEPRALKGNFIGYAENSKTYRVLDSSYNVIVETRDVEVIEINLKLIPIQLVNQSIILKLK